MSQCINTLFNNTSIKPKETYILDDGSNPDIQKGILQFAQDYSNVSPINVYLNGRNKGVGYQFETAYKIADSLEDIDLVCFIESDYIWRKGWLEDVVAVFEASPYTIAIAGCDHPDMKDRSKTHGEFCKLMVDQFGRDLNARQFLYKPFKLKTKRGEIEVEGVSNSCGCQIIHWQRLQSILNRYDHQRDYWKWMDRAFHKNGTGSRKFASDAHMSGTLAMYSEGNIEAQGEDISRFFGFLNICDYSISSHQCALGINGKIPGIKEGETFIISPSWDNKYLNEDPRKIIDKI